MSKYDPLRDFLNSLPRGQKQVTLGFKRVETMLGEPLPPSALEYEQWWRGGRAKRGRIDANWQDQVQQRAWGDVGWTVDGLDLLLRNVTVRRKGAWLPTDSLRSLVGRGGNPKDTSVWPVTCTPRCVRR